MEATDILKYHWDSFLSHICEFHNLEKKIITEYEDELNWQSLSKNKQIDWDIEFIEKYQNHINWFDIATLETIIWTSEYIEKFKKRLEWNHLCRNKNLPISKEFIEKYSKKILYITEENPLLTEELIKQYNLRVIKKNSYDSQIVKQVTIEKIDSILLKRDRTDANQYVLYRDIFLPIINQFGLEEIFKNKFNYSQQYYYFEPLALDIHGLTPQFEIDGDNQFDKFHEGRGLIEISEKMTLINGSLQEGPARLLEVPRFSSFSFYTTIIVSENVKSILKHFKLPKHTFHEIILKPKKITTTTKFYILQIDCDTLNKDLDYNERTFLYKYDDFQDKGYGTVEEKITNHDELIFTKDTLTKKYSPRGYGIKITPDIYKLNTDFDLYSYSVHGVIIINKYLKDTLEKYFPNQINFKSAQLMNIKIDQEKYDSKAYLSINVKQSSTNYKTSDEDNFFYAKVDRLESNDNPIDKELLENDNFMSKAVELNIVFPKIFKNNYLTKNIKIQGYTVLSISKFYIQNEYADRYPETYKSVVIAENGVGDSINLILEQDSDFLLRNKLFEFFHETGEYEEK